MVEVPVSGEFSRGKRVETHELGTAPTQQKSTIGIILRVLLRALRIYRSYPTVSEYPKP